jgi:hypothetical protein
MKHHNPHPSVFSILWQEFCFGSNRIGWLSTIYNVQCSKKKMSFSDNGMMNSLYITQASQALTRMMEKKTNWM